MQKYYTTYPYGDIYRTYTLGGYADRKIGHRAEPRCTGKERDIETGLHYFGARYYDSDLGRWLQVDPLADKYPGWSPYNYCVNNPLRFVDLWGMEPEGDKKNEYMGMYLFPEAVVIGERYKVNILPDYGKIDLHNYFIPQKNVKKYAISNIASNTFGGFFEFGVASENDFDDFVFYLEWGYVYGTELSLGLTTTEEVNKSLDEFIDLRSNSFPNLSANFSYSVPISYGISLGGSIPLEKNAFSNLTPVNTISKSINKSSVKTGIGAGASVTIPARRVNSEKLNPKTFYNIIKALIYNKVHFK